MKQTRITIFGQSIALHTLARSHYNIHKLSLACLRMR